MRIDANSRQCPVTHRAIQPPIGVELVSILPPEVFITAISRTVTHPKPAYVTAELTDGMQQ